MVLTSSMLIQSRNTSHDNLELSGSMMAASLTSSSTNNRRRARDIADCMEVGTAVGTGTYGVVYKAVDKSDPERPFVALKKIKMERETQGFPVTAIREIKILNLMSHENVVRLREIITYDKEGDENEDYKSKGIFLGDVFMVFEYVDFDLDGLLKNPNFVVTNDIIKSYMHQLLTGVQYLHDKKLLHRDLKSANLLISKNHVLKIADWGLARTLPPSGHKLTVPVVTLWYRSPELCFGSKLYGTEVDMWSVGCIFAELKQKKALFCAGTEPEIVELIFRLLGSPQGILLDQYKSFPDWEKINFNKAYTSRLQNDFGRHFDVMGISLLERLLDLDPKTRIKASEALEHRYLTPESIPSPSSLPVIDLSEAAAQERARREREEQQRRAAEEQRKAAEQQRAREERERMSITQARPKTARENDRKNNPKLNQFSFIGKKPAPPPSQPPPDIHGVDSDTNPQKKQRTDSNPPPPPVPYPAPSSSSSSHHYPPAGHYHHHSSSSYPPPPPVPPPNERHISAYNPPQPASSSSYREYSRDYHNSSSTNTSSSSHHHHAPPPPVPSHHYPPTSATSSHAQAYYSSSSSSNSNNYRDGRDRDRDRGQDPRDYRDSSRDHRPPPPPSGGYNSSGRR